MITTHFGIVKLWHTFKYGICGQMFEFVRVPASEHGEECMVYNAVDIDHHNPALFHYQDVVYVDNANSVGEI